MTSIRVKGFKIFNDRHGRPRCYHRATGMPIDLSKYPLGTAEFFAECTRIMALQKAQGSPRPGTLGQLVHQYKKSPAWLNLQPSTREWYDDIFQSITNITDQPLSKFTRPLLVRLRDKAYQKHGWYFANKFKSTLSMVFSWGVERGFVDDNPAKQIRKIARPKDLPRANRPWTYKEYQTVFDAASERLRVLIALMKYTGMDPVDAVKLMKNQYDGQAIEYRRTKTGNPVWVPALTGLKQALSNAPKHNAVTIAANSYGNPWTVDGLNTTWLKLRGKLEKGGGLAKGLTLKGLRHTMATELRELGFDNRTIADTLGQNTEAMARHYSRDADMREKMQKVFNLYDASDCIKQSSFVKPNQKQRQTQGDETC